MPSRSLLDHDIVNAQWQCNLYAGTDAIDWSVSSSLGKSHPQSNNNNIADKHHNYHRHHSSSSNSLLDVKKLANLRRVSAIVLDSIRMNTVSTVQSFWRPTAATSCHTSSTNQQPTIGDDTEHHCSPSGIAKEPATNDKKMSSLPTKCQNSEAHRIIYNINKRAYQQQIVDSLNYKIERLRSSSPINVGVINRLATATTTTSASTSCRYVPKKQQQHPRFYWSYCLLASMSLLMAASFCAQVITAETLADMSELTSFDQLVNYQQQQQSLNPLESRQDTHASLVGASSVVPTSPAAGEIQARSIHDTGNDYGDDELEIMSGQTQIPTAHLFAAAGHVVPENFFAPGGTIPLIYSTAQQQQQQNHQADSQQQQQGDPEVASSATLASYIDPSSYGLATGAVASNGAAVTAANGHAPNSADMNDMLELFGGPTNTFYSLIGGQQSSSQGQQQSVATGQQSDVAGQAGDELPVIYTHAGHIDGTSGESRQQALQDLLLGLGSHQMASKHQSALVTATSSNANNKYQYIMPVGSHQSGNVYGLPTKTGSAPYFPLAPPRATTTISSPTLNMLQHLPKMQEPGQLVSKIPMPPTPTVSFSSSKDPMQGVKAVNQKKRNVMRQAENLVKTVIEQVNKRFGTTIGDQSDLPFVLSTLGPLGMAQNLLTDPSFLITLLSTTEKNLFSNALPAPANAIIRPALNLFRMPNKKRDKANILNVISYLARGSNSQLSNNHRSNGMTSKGTGIKPANKRS